MNRMMLATAVVVGGLTLATTAEAIKVGDKVYIKSKNTRVLSKPKATANVVKVLQPGNTVTWNGSATRDKKWQKIAFEGRSGIVYLTTLSPKPPKMEMTQSGQSVDAMAVASSGAATKALGEGAKAYGDKSNLKEAVKSIEVLERLAKKITPKIQAKHAKKYKLAPNVGADK